MSGSSSSVESSASPSTFKASITLDEDELGNNTPFGVPMIDNINGLDHIN